MTVTARQEVCGTVTIGEGQQPDNGDGTQPGDGNGGDQQPTQPGPFQQIPIGLVALFLLAAALYVLRG